ncbi:hypothetical protein V8F20_001728 [Naviculisporaceae sp. PSN 640]
MQSKLAIVYALLAVAEARFGREQEATAAISALSDFGAPGAAATLAGASPSVLLAGANACAKLELADRIVAELGNDPQVIAAAAVLVQAEKNTNPFAVAIPSLCSDANLPATAELRGIIPLIDPDTVGSDVQNANAAQSLQNPFNADGLSVADISAAQGFTNFTAQGSDGSTAAPAGGNAGNAGNAGDNNNNNGGNNNAGNDNNNNGGNANCGATVTVTVQAPAATAAPADNGNNQQGGNGNDNNQQDGNDNGNNQQDGNDNGGNQQGGNQGLDFGTCTPTMDFQLGRPGRKPDEGTFLPTDPNVALGQQDALNPNIITNRICDQLTNICNANQAAKDACQAARAIVQGLGTKDATTADAFNQALGF